MVNGEVMYSASLASLPGIGGMRLKRNDRAIFRQGLTNKRRYWLSIVINMTIREATTSSFPRG